MRLDIKVDSARVRRMLGKLGPKTIREIRGAAHTHVKLVAKRLQGSLYQTKNKTPDRLAAAKKIKPKKLSADRYVVTMPRSLIKLDSKQVNPYVALKRGRRITAWARKYFGTKVVSGRSKVSKGIRGGIKPKSALYVTHYPFIERALRRSRSSLKQLLKTATARAVRR